MIKDFFVSKKSEAREKAFWKLKQLDRVEYLLLGKKYSDQTNYSSVKYGIFVLAFLAYAFLLAFLYYILSDDPLIFNTVILLKKVSLVLLIALIISDIFKYFLLRKQIIELNKKYLKI